MTKWTEIPEHLERIIGQESARVARMNRHIVTKDDLAQEIRLWMVKHPKRMRNWWDKDNLEEPLSVFRKIAYRRCQDYVAKERAYRTGGMPSDSFLYSVGLIEAVLPAFLNDETEAPLMSDADSTTRRHRVDPSEGNEWFAVRADVSVAWDSLDDEDRELLYARYGPHVKGENKLEVLAERYGWSVPTVSRRCHKLIERMAEVLGGVAP